MRKVFRLVISAFLLMLLAVLPYAAVSAQAPAVPPAVLGGSAHVDGRPAAAGAGANNDMRKK